MPEGLKFDRRREVDFSPWAKAHCRKVVVPYRWLKPTVGLKPTVHVRLLLLWGAIGECRKSSRQFKLVPINFNRVLSASADYRRLITVVGFS